MKRKKIKIFLVFKLFVVSKQKLQVVRHGSQNFFFQACSWSIVTTMMQSKRLFILLSEKFWGSI